MFEILPTMYYAIFDKENSNIITPDYPPILDVESKEAVKKELPIKHCWYDEYNLCLKAAFTVTTRRGQYVLFVLKDYGINDFQGIAFTIDESRSNRKNTYIYHVISYDIHDCICLCAPVESMASLDKLELHLMAARYNGTCSTEYIYSKPQPITHSILKKLSIIEKQREAYTEFPESTATSNLKFRSKLPYKKDFLVDAWKGYPQAVDFIKLLNTKCDLLESLINQLPASMDEIDISAPENNDSVVFIPLECTYNQKFFARLYMARKHNIGGRIVSSFDLIQYQIPIKASNEPLLLCLYGSHWIQPVMFSENSESIGDDKCTNIYEKAVQYSPVLAVISEVRKHPFMRIWTPIIRKSTIGERYSVLVNRLTDWINQRTKEAIQQSESLRPSLWKSEYRLYQYTKLLCPEAVYQYHSDWLGTQSLDIFIPGENCAIEYQGRQHYDSIDYFGGNDGLAERQENDRCKLQKCITNGVKLLEWSYKDKLLFSNVLEFLNAKIFTNPVDRKYIEGCLVRGLPFPVSDLFLPVTFSQLKSDVNTKVTKPIQEIRKYNLDGEYICAYSSISDAARDAAVSMQQVQKVISGRATTAGGFLWERVNADMPVCTIPPMKKKENENTSKAIYQVDLTGEIIAEYESINSAERQTRVNRKSIRDVLNGRQKTAGGYYWIYKNLEKEESLEK